MAFKLIKELLHFIPGSVPKTWKSMEEIQSDRPIIILIAGFSSSHSSVRVMRKRLIKDHYNVLIQPLSYQNVLNGYSGFTGHAQELKRLVETLRKRTDLKDQKIFILAHSAGGLIARYYIQQLQGHRFCDGLVTMATPHEGLWLSALGFFFHLAIKAKCLYDILPVSKFVRELNSCNFPSSFPMASFYSQDDVLCPPRLSRIPDKYRQEPQVEEHAFIKVSHSGFLFQKQPYLMLKKWLQKQFNQSENPTDYSSFRKTS